MTKLPWKKGQLEIMHGPMLVSATRFTYKRFWHMPGVFWNGFVLRSSWPIFEGSLGVSISADLKRRSTYTVSLWRSEEDLKKFIAHPSHLILMKNYRHRLESSSSATWNTEHFSLSEAWKIAWTKLSGMPELT